MRSVKLMCLNFGSVFVFFMVKILLAA